MTSIPKYTVSVSSGGVPFTDINDPETLRINSAKLESTIPISKEVKTIIDSLVRRCICGCDGKDIKGQICISSDRVSVIQTNSERMKALFDVALIPNLSPVQLNSRS